MRYWHWPAMVLLGGSIFAAGAPPNTAATSLPGPSNPDDAAAIRAAEYQQRLKKALAEMTPAQRQEMDAERARRNRIPLPTDEYDWRRVAAKRGVSDDEIRRLADQKILVGPRQMLQTFDVYTAPTVPVFITSDALLNGYNALFEDSFRELEIRRAPQLRAFLEQVVTRSRSVLKDPPYPIADLAPGWQQAQRVVGPAMVLLGTPLDFFDAEVRNDITTEVERIREARVVALPRWLAPATPQFSAVDYRRMKPIGFYAGLTSLADYFRAVRWLQTVPFRPERDVEFTAIAVLRAGMGRNPTRRDFLSEYEHFLGATRDPDLSWAWFIIPEAHNASRPASWSANLQQTRAEMSQLKSYVNDSLGSTNTASALKPYHVLAAYILPDAEMLQALVDQSEPVTALYVARVLGSNVPFDIAARNPAVVASAIKHASDQLFFEQWPGGSGLRVFEANSPTYDDYLAALRTLFAPADPDAPKFMSSVPWTIKCTQTCLAGWAQMRHTFILQAGQVIATSGLHDQPPGFIEPNPEFLRRLSELIEHTETKLAAAGVFSSDAASMGALLRTRADGLDRLVGKIKAGVDRSKITEYNEVNGWAQHAGAFTGLGAAPETGALFQAAWGALEGATRSTEPLEKLSAYLKQRAAGYERGELAVPAEEHHYDSLEDRWQTLARTVARLETLLQKQLRQRPWSDDEAKFIKDFGPTLAAAMGYFGNMYSPRDDAARCVEFVRYGDRDVSLNAAIGRPRTIYVLYPWDGREIYCEGAVLPYYEFESNVQLTDEQWRDRLDAPKAPAQPAWTNPITDGPPKPLPDYMHDARISHD